MSGPECSIQNLRLHHAGIVVCPPNAGFGPRKLKDYEFVWVIEGSAVVTVNGREVALSPGTILLCQPGMMDRYRWMPDHETIHAFFHFDFDLPSRGWPPRSKWPLTRDTPQNDILRPLFRYFMELYQLKEPLRTMLAHPCINLMLRSFVSGKISQATEPHVALPPSLEKVLKEVRKVSLETPMPRLTLRQMADTAHVTPEHLCRLFRQAMNSSPSKYVRRVRLRRAAMLLLRTSLAIKEIASRAGFVDPYHFSQAFRQTYGLSPRKYREAALMGKPLPGTRLVHDFRVPLWGG